MSATNQDRRHRRKLVPIFTTLGDAFIADIITDCTAVQFEENDGLPSAICHDCFETVKLLEAFKKTTRDSDTKLRKLHKEELPRDVGPSGSSPVVEEQVLETSDIDISSTQLLELKCEPLEHTVQETGEEAALENEDFEPENDTDSDWNVSDEEEKRAVKRKKVGLKSKPKPRKRSGSPSPEKRRKRIQRIPVQSQEDLQLSEKEQELFTVIDVKPKSHICCGCLQAFGTADELEAHRKLNHVWKREKQTKPSPKLTCDGCLRRFNSTKNINYHKDRVRLLKVVWECNKCKLRFKVAGKRREHLRLHPDGEPVAMIARIRETTKQELGWVCCGRNCKQSFPTEAELISHGQASHWIDKQEADLECADKPEQCQVCYQRFSDRKKIVHHQRRKYKFKNFQCALCGLKFFTTDDLNMHEAREHSYSTFQCEICMKTFTRKNSMMNHMKNMHTEGKQHQCTVCGMTFRQKAGLKIHMSNHVEVPQYKCEVCSKMFKAKLHLRYHMRTHTGEKPYKCRYCDSAFANHTNYRRHEMTHTDDKPHKCSYCERSFILKRTLLEHESSHTGEPKPKRKASNKQADQETVPITEHIEIIELEDVVEEDDVSSDDASYDQQPIEFGNRPVTIRVARPIDPQPVNVVHLTSPQPVQNVVANASSVDIQSASIVYNVVPTSGSYILKF